MTDNCDRLAELAMILSQNSVIFVTAQPEILCSGAVCAEDMFLYRGEGSEGVGDH